MNLSHWKVLSRVQNCTLGLWRLDGVRHGNLDRGAFHLVYNVPVGQRPERHAHGDAAMKEPRKSPPSKPQSKAEDKLDEELEKSFSR